MDVDQLDQLLAQSPDGLDAAAAASRREGLKAAQTAINAAPGELDALRAQHGALQATADKCEKIAANARSQGREDLAAAADARRQSSLDQLGSLQAQEAELTLLIAKSAAVAAALAMPQASSAEAAPAAAVADASSSDGDADWEKELAALMASDPGVGGGSPSPAASAAPAASDAGSDDIDDILAGLPSLDDIDDSIGLEDGGEEGGGGEMVPAADNRPAPIAKGPPAAEDAARPAGDKKKKKKDKKAGKALAKTGDKAGVPSKTRMRVNMALAGLGTILAMAAAWWILF